VIILLYDGFSKTHSFFDSKQGNKVLKIDRYFLDHKCSEDITPNNIGLLRLDLVPRLWAQKPGSFNSSGWSKLQPTIID
jgi:hypothetical protein